MENKIDYFDLIQYRAARSGKVYISIISSYYMMII